MDGALPLGAGSYSSRARVASHDQAPTISLPDNEPLLQHGASNTVRRPRAGTMPSMLGIHAPIRPDNLRRQLSGLSLHDGSADIERDAMHGSAYGGVDNGGSLLAPPTASSRLRSGSLTLPLHGVGQAFGPGVFSSTSWTPTDNSGRPSPIIPEEVRSVASDEEAGDMAGTLDYLGLIGSPLTSPTASTMSGPSIDAQLQALQARVAAEAPNRLRANTVATVTRPSAAAGLQQEAALLRLDGQNGGLNGAAVGDAAVPAALRPRAATIALLHDGGKTHGSDHATPSPHLSPEMASLAPPMSRAASSSSHDAAGSAAGRSPAWTTVEMPTTSALPPSRSLWIGNLDSRTGTAELMQTFSPYGSIESIRVLPEKDCAFVNFATIQSAINAREDVLVRLGGQITRTPGIAVRIGFGRADNAPASSFGPPPSLPSQQQSSDSQNTPTRALWIGSIPPAAVPNDLLHIFGQWGPIESARVLVHKSCAFVNFERLDDAVRARKALNGRDIFGGEIGQVKIGFAKVPVKQPGSADAGLLAQPVPPSAIAASAHVKGAAAVPAEQQQQLAQGNGPIHDYRSSLLLSMVAGSTGLESSAVAGPARPFGALPGVSDLQLMVRELAPEDPSLEKDLAAVAETPPPMSYYSIIPAPPGAPLGPQGFSDGASNINGRARTTDVTRLRDIRKRFDAGELSQDDVDGLAYELLDDSAVLSSDYIGNTVIQKLYEHASSGARIALLERIAPHLASIGIHKNGTWAAQKLIDLASTPEEIELICRHLKPFVPPLLLDQFGNYVVGATLKYGSPATDFIFDAMYSRCWEIGQGRFGARSMRTCLESSHTPRLQQKRVASAIIFNAIPLATSPNGALLLTWLLDTSNFSGRYRLLAPRFAPHLAHLCTHKLASTTVLRLINQSVDVEASRLLTDTIFESSPQTLEDILGDQMQGVSFVQKIMASPYLQEGVRQSCATAIRRAIETMQLEQVPAYAQLLHHLTHGPPPSFSTSSSGPPSQRLSRQSSPHAHPRSSPAPHAAHPGWASPSPSPFYPPFTAAYMPPMSRAPSDYPGMPYSFSAAPPDPLPPQMMSPSPAHMMRRGPDAGSPMPAAYYQDGYGYPPHHMYGH